GGSPYAIPPDNPFASGGGRPEIYAWGLRNPWRYSFDAATGDLWLADVGQDRIEEIDLVRLGGNYGWNRMEGDACYAAPNCNPTGLELPVVTMDHSEGHNSVTGGVVYRGSAIPDLVGRYVWADYSSGQIFALGEDPVTGDPVRMDLLPTGIDPTHVGAGADGELIFVSRNNGLYRLEPTGNPGPSTFPQTLEETGCFDATGGPLPMLVPFEVAHPFWSDGADKERFLAIPDGARMTVDAEGRVVFPLGSVLVKQFRVSGKKVETRLLVRHDDGAWAGYAWAWDDTGTAATLLAGAQTVTGGAGEDWRVPSRAECLRCHNLDGGQPLGPRIDQLDIDATQANGWVENQIDELVRLDMMEAPASRPGALVALDSTAPVEERARAWLDVNCAFCHLPAGPGGGTLDLRVETPLASTGMCAAPERGDLGITGALVVTPGDPSLSILSSRIGRRDVHMMPPLGTTQVDVVGSGVVDQWITELTSCP
ncbi:MAG: PQQ-dependent sugar dehydrogenase, partial [Myxococcales bacterium]|nr:PQQ-dependent sugar dehydrogenase [Myxococcales bacterium]